MSAEEGALISALEPWLASELVPSLSPHLVQTSGEIVLPLALICVLPALCHSAILAFSCQSAAQQCFPNLPRSFPPDPAEYVAVRAAALPLALLATPLPIPLALALIRASRRALAGCCCGARPRSRKARASSAYATYAADSGFLVPSPPPPRRNAANRARATPSRSIELFVALVASAFAYALAAVAGALPAAALMPAVRLDFDVPPGGGGFPLASAALATFGTSLMAIVALHSMLFAKAHPRGVLSLALLALALFGCVTYESLRRRQRADELHVL